MNITLLALAVAIFLSLIEIAIWKNRNTTHRLRRGAHENSHITSILCYIAIDLWLPVRKFLSTQRQRRGQRWLSIKKKKSRSVAGTARDYSTLAIYFVSGVFWRLFGMGIGYIFLRQI